ncbi:MAG: hypothetical protein FWJ87_16345 [Micromonosporaceae bacterium]|jgi:hypothetical protein
MDLRELMEERSAAEPPTIMHHLRLAGVRRKVVARRRRRLAVGALTVAAVTAGSLAAGSVLTGSGDPVSPAARTIEGFPHYAEGARVVAAAAAPLSERTVSVTFTPTTTELVGFARCDLRHGADPPPVVAEVRINGVLVWGVQEVGDTGGFCGGPRNVESFRWDAYPGFAEAGLRVGEPATVTMTIADGRGVDEAAPAGPDDAVVPADAPALSGGRFAVAIGERVPFEAYPFPPRPDELVPLRISPAGDPALELRADPSDPDRPVEARFRWPATAAYTVQVAMQTPGSLTVLVDGVEVGRVEKWDYEPRCAEPPGLSLRWEELRDAGLTARPGDPVTVTVQPRHVTGDWYLRLNPAGRYYC